jgi:hypothetical protein
MDVVLVKGDQPCALLLAGVNVVGGLPRPVALAKVKNNGLKQHHQRFRRCGSRPWNTTVVPGQLKPD